MDNSLKIFLVSIFIILVFRCANSNSADDRETVREQKDTSFVDFIPDISVNGLELGNSETLKKNQIPEINDVIIEEPQESLPFMSFISRNGNEKLTAYCFYGSGDDEFYQFKIEYKLDHPSSQEMKSDFIKFSTESGIKLGISREDLLKIKGNNFVIEGDVIMYKLDDFNNSSFLQKYNLPIYFSKYTFKNNKLIEIYFGFEYP